MEAVGAEVSQNDGETNSDHRNSGGEHAEAQTGDYHSGGTRLRALSHLLSGLVALRGLVFRRLTDDHTGQQTDDHRE